jgi:methylenetetrahydrofolate reductase (NADPH)
VLSEKQLHRVLELSGEAMPTELLHALRAADEPASVGIAHAAALSGEVLAAGAPGIHLYTSNRSEAPLAILGEVGLLTSREIPA